VAKTMLGLHQPLFTSNGTPFIIDALHAHRRFPYSLQQVFAFVSKRVLDMPWTRDNVPLQFLLLPITLTFGCY
jgi:hypothetical protein